MTCGEGKNMLNRLRMLLGKGAQSPVQEIAFEDLPVYIERQESSIREHLENEVVTRRPQIATAIAGLQEILEAFSSIERTPPSHPKLEKIAQSSLPHFLRSFQQHLNRPLPQEAEAYYHEVGVLLKGSITTMKGAGKYLPAVFPDKMKALRFQLGIIGRTMNELTAIFSQAKAEREQLSSVRGRWNTIRSLIVEQTERKARMDTLRTRAQNLQEEKERIQKSLEELQRSDDYRILMDQQEHLARLKEEVKERKLQKEQSLGAVLSVCRRAARIARHQNNREKEKKMEEFIDLLESSPRDCEQIQAQLQGTLPLITEMIVSGTLSLKGQDEHRIFSSPEVATGEVFQACREIRAGGDLLDQKERMIAEMPVHTDLLRLKGEESRVIHAGEKLLQEQEEQETALRDLPERIRTLLDDLDRQIPEIFKGECSIRFAKLGEIKEQIP
jgi:hypothetical protein